MDRTPVQIKRRYQRIKNKKSEERRQEILKDASPPPVAKRMKPNTSDFTFSVLNSLESSMDTTGDNSGFGSPPIFALQDSLGSINQIDDGISKNTLKEMLIQLSIYQMRELQQKVLNDRIRLGEFIHRHQGGWIEGKAFIQLNERQQLLDKKKEQLENQKKLIKSEKTKLSKIVDTNLEELEDKKLSLQLREELNRVNLNQIKKEEGIIQSQREKLNSERELHYLEYKLVQEHNASSFSDHRVLKERYLLLNLLGKGGFSHVYAAFDLKNLVKVACKIHQPDPSWSVGRKRNYIHHATRECRIQKNINHRRVVQLSDVFLIDGDDSFCTILEYCNDGDLDYRMRLQSKFSEKETRCIIVQVVDAIYYLNNQDHPIIHYDLKPGNILFHDGEVKITDFGLSKIIEDRESGVLDLTSQGAGTYWYLPPECFSINQPRISSKVDVWSIGVLCYQLLFGKKPFANNVPAVQILQNQMINSQSKVEFPTTIKVSDKATDFIKQCLITDQEKRPGVNTLVKHPFITKS